MTNTNKNFAAAYVLLVAFPVLGLAGILRSGRNLTAPMSLGGVWNVQADASKLTALHCGKLLDSPQGMSFTISQSGTNFTLGLANSGTSLASGTIDGETLQARILPTSEPAKQTGCSARGSVTIVAKVDPKATPPSLQGTLSASSCEGCVLLEFHAIREDRSRSKGGQ